MIRVVDTSDRKKVAIFGQDFSFYKIDPCATQKNLKKSNMSLLASESGLDIKTRLYMAEAKHVFILEPILISKSTIFPIACR